MQYIKIAFMKTYTITFLILFNCSSLIGQAIDSLKTDRQVETFIQSNDNFKQFYVVTLSDLYRDSLNKHIADSLNVKPWAKADFNNDKKTDLMVYGVWNGSNILMVYITGLNNGTFHFITQVCFDHICFPTVATFDNQIVLINNVAKEYYINETPQIKTDTLIYKFNTFIELNSSPSHYQFDKIELTSFESKNDSMVYSVTIYADKTAKYHTTKYTEHLGNYRIKEVRGSFDFISTVDTTFNEFNELIALINYLDLPKAKDTYSSSKEVEITYQIVYSYNHQQSKKIKFQIDDATYGLAELFRRIDKMREQFWIWKKI